MIRVDSLAGELEVRQLIVQHGSQIWLVCTLGLSLLFSNNFQNNRQYWE